MARGHEWGPYGAAPADWDGAQCKKCGKVATNATIASKLYLDPCLVASKKA